MSKKNYMAPAAKVIITKCAAIIAASRATGSVDGVDATIGWGGEGTGKSADSRGGGFWDDEE